MASTAQEFKSSGTMKEFVDDEGRHFYVIQFADDSGLVFKKGKMMTGVQWRNLLFAMNQSQRLSRRSLRLMGSQSPREIHNTSFGSFWPMNRIRLE